LYTQSEFGNLENYLLEKKYYKNISCEQVLNTYIFTGAVELKKHRFKKASIFLINFFDEKALEIMNKTFFLLCIIISLVTIANFLGNDSPDWFYILCIISSLIPLIISLFIKNVLEYHHDTFCKKCGKKLACEEIGDPVMKETSSFGDYSLTVTRHWKCRYCGDMEIRESPENIFAEQGEMLPEFSLKNIECKKCSETGTVVELKKPDIKEIGKRRLTRRYYKCTVCGHEHINESEEIVNRRKHVV
jgi:DNA-directed RNA polymerase subunit RPC12/RpoP